MARAITVLVATLLFGLCGLLIGWLNIQAEIGTYATGGRVSGGDLLLSYLIAPLGGAVVGFVLSVVTLKKFAPPGSRN